MSTFVHNLMSTNQKPQQCTKLGLPKTFHKSTFEKKYKYLEKRNHGLCICLYKCRFESHENDLTTSSISLKYLLFQIAIR